MAAVADVDVGEPAVPVRVYRPVAGNAGARGPAGV
ncbi:MAG: hypothetical protein JWM31_1898, partial [Solirubrobacterales bacterium]|nr:hypothetical protein [Solirubrobacterales bacterium]